MTLLALKGDTKPPLHCLHMICLGNNDGGAVAKVGNERVIYGAAVAVVVVSRAETVVETCGCGCERSTTNYIFIVFILDIVSVIYTHICVCQMI